MTLLNNVKLSRICRHFGFAMATGGRKPVACSKMLIFSPLVNFGRNVPSSLLRWQNGLGTAWPGREPEVKRPEKISLHRSTCKTTFARLTQSQAISQSFRVFISFRSMRDTTFFHFSKLFLIQNYRFLYHGDQKISWWTLQVAGSQLRNPPVKFRHER